MDINTLHATMISGIPIWIICLGALLCLLIDAIWPRKMTQVVFGVGIITLFISLISAFGQWENPNLAFCHNYQFFQNLGFIGETAVKKGFICTQAQMPQVFESMQAANLLVMDQLSLFLVVVISLIGILSLFNSLGYLRIHKAFTSEYSSLMLFSIVGMVVFFASDHLIVNFIGLETMSLAIYALVGSHKKSWKSSEAAVKYFVLGGVASAVLLYGIALFYGGYGDFRLSLINVQVVNQDLAPLQTIGLTMLLVGILFKLAIVPFHFWAPDVYQGAPSPVTGFMATAVKTAAFGFLLRIFKVFELYNLPKIQELLLVLVVLTLLVGNLVAIQQTDIKRMLAYSSVSHAGFLLLGLLVGFEDGVYKYQNVEVVLFYLFAYFLMTIGAFTVLSFMANKTDEATSYSDLAGFGKSHPLLAAVLSLFLLSMMGLPGTVGFTAKYNVISLAVKNHFYGLAIFAVIMSVVSAFYYLRPISVMFFQGKARKEIIHEMPWTLFSSTTFCALAVLFFGFNPDTFIKLSHVTAYEYMDKLESADVYKVEENESISMTIK